MVRLPSARPNKFEIPAAFIGLFIVLIALAPVVLGQRAVAPQIAIEKERPANALTLDQTDPFLPTVPYDTGVLESSSMAVADLNQDGKQDVVLVNNNGDPNSLIAVLLGNGDGTFLPAVVYDAAAPGMVSVAVGDLNNDGKPDVVVAGVDSVSVFIGNGDGSFKPAVVYALGGVASVGGRFPLQLADLNGDGKLDVIVRSQTNLSGGNGSAVVLLNNGDGTLQPSKSYDAGGYFTTSVAVADLNADGIPDLVVVNCAPAGSTACWSAGGTVGVLLGKGDGTFRPVQSYARGGWGFEWDPVIVADVNGDGKPDILVGNVCAIKLTNHGHDGVCTNDGSVGILSGNGDGTFRPVVTYDSGGSDAASIVLADMDGDGKLDLVVQNGISSAVLRGKGDGTFLFPDMYDGGEMPGAAVSVADLNGDGKPDLIGIGGSSIDFIWVMLGNGSGFTAPFTYITGVGLSQPVIQDVNSDGRPDLLAIYACSNPFGCGGIDGTLGVQLGNPGFIYNSTVTKLTANVDLAAPNQPVTYTVVVSDPAASTVTGSVLCLDRNRQFRNQTLVNNQATFSITYPSAATHEVQCSYSGDSENLGSTSLNLPVYIKALPVPSQTLLASSESPSHVGQTVTFTATITSKDGTIPNGELVTFSDGKIVLGSVPISASTATFATSSLAAKKHTIKAVYAGDGSFKASQKSITQTVTP
jgi:hypothetical protein